MTKPLKDMEGKTDYIKEIFEWLDVNFLLEMARTMRAAVEAGKYDKGSWRKMKDADILRAASDRHNLKARCLWPDKTECGLIDPEFDTYHDAHAAINHMFAWYIDTKNQSAFMEQMTLDYLDLAMEELRGEEGDVWDVCEFSENPGKWPPNGGCCSPSPWTED